MAMNYEQKKEFDKLMNEGNDNFYQAQVFEEQGIYSNARKYYRVAGQKFRSANEIASRSHDASKVDSYYKYKEAEIAYRNIENYRDIEKDY